MKKKDYKARIENALDMALHHKGHDGAHHKDWVIDQMVRALLGGEGGTDGREYTTTDDYNKFVTEAKDGEDGPETYEWDVGIPP